MTLLSDNFWSKWCSVFSPLVCREIHVLLLLASQSDATYMCGLFSAYTMTPLTSPSVCQLFNSPGSALHLCFQLERVPLFPRHQNSGWHLSSFPDLFSPLHLFSLSDVGTKSQGSLKLESRDTFLNPCLPYPDVIRCYWFYLSTPHILPMSPFLLLWPIFMPPAFFSTCVDSLRVLTSVAFVAHVVSSC